MTANPKLPAEKPVPVNIDAERSVLASLMVDPSAMDRIQALVSASDFYQDAHRWTFDTSTASSRSYGPARA